MDRKLLAVAKYIFYSVSDCHGRCGRDYCYSKEIMSIADAMEDNGMKDAGYKYINLDGM